jgi:hypothetical protein
MPFTPFHFGPAILVGLLLLKYLDFPAFLAANVITDWRAALVFLGFWPPPRHSWVHTYLGSFLMALILAGLMAYLRPYFDELFGDLMERFNFNQEFSAEKVFLASFSGVTLHITLDAFHHPTINPFYPIMEKPLFGLMSTLEVTLLASLFFVLALPLFFLQTSGRVDFSEILQSIKNTPPRYSI